MKSIDKFNTISEQLQKCIKSEYDEHLTADRLLTEIALDTEFTEEERMHLVELYEKVYKDYDTTS